MVEHHQEGQAREQPECGCCAAFREILAFDDKAVTKQRVE